MTAIKTQVLSTRVPVEVMTAIDDICKKTGVNRSQWLTTTVSVQQSDYFLKKGGSIQTRTIPKEVQNMLATAGTATVGILAYNVIGSMLEKSVDENGKPKFTDGEVEFISIITALGIAMAGYGAIKALMQ